MAELGFLYGCGQGNGMTVRRAKLCKQMIQNKCMDARNSFSLPGESIDVKLSQW